MSTYRCLFYNLKAHIMILKINIGGVLIVDLVSIGKRIQKCRKQKGYTQEQLADMMNVSIQMVSNLERGNKAIRIDNLINLSQILDVSTDYILTGKETTNDTQSLTSLIRQLPEENRSLIRMLVDYFLKKKT